MKFKYKLQAGSKHTTCPACNFKKVFKPYVLADSNQIVDESKYGRCERINSCGYICYPERENDFDWQPPERTPEPPKRPDFILKEVVERTFSNFRDNIFFRFLVKTFDVDTAFELQEKYNIGTAKGGGTIFWQQDREGNFRTGKVFYYQMNGKRNKERASWYIHNQVKEGFSLVQVFFGENLTFKNPGKPVALCESEKTAILMSVFEPKYTWVATGGANMINISRLARLNRLDFVSPDQGQFDLWKLQTALHRGREMDIRVERAFKNGEVDPGADILDLILKQKKNKL